MSIDPTFSATVAVLLVQFFQYLREGRQHKWLVDQAKADQDERVRIAKELQEHNDKRSQVVVKATTDGVKILSDKIDDNTEISTKAFNEANGVNNKLVAIGEARLSGNSSDRGKVAAIKDSVDHIAVVVEDTNEAVKKLV